MGNDMAGNRSEISTFVRDNCVDVFVVDETWLSAQGDEAKTVEIAPSGFDVKSFPRQSRFRQRRNCYNIQIYIRL